MMLAWGMKNSDAWCLMKQVHPDYCAYGFDNRRESIECSLYQLGHVSCSIFLLLSSTHSTSYFLGPNISARLIVISIGDRLFLSEYLFRLYMLGPFRVGVGQTPVSFVLFLPHSCTKKTWCMHYSHCHSYLQSASIFPFSLWSMIRAQHFVFVLAFWRLFKNP